MLYRKMAFDGGVTIDQGKTQEQQVRVSGMWRNSDGTDILLGKV